MNYISNPYFFVTRIAHSHNSNSCVWFSLRLTYCTCITYVLLMVVINLVNCKFRFGGKFSFVVIVFFLTSFPELPNVVHWMTTANKHLQGRVKTVK